MGKGLSPAGGLRVVLLACLPILVPCAADIDPGSLNKDYTCGTWEATSGNVNAVGQGGGRVVLIAPPVPYGDTNIATVSWELVKRGNLSSLAWSVPPSRSISNKDVYVYASTPNISPNGKVVTYADCAAPVSDQGIGEWICTEEWKVLGNCTAFAATTFLPDNTASIEFVHCEALQQPTPKICTAHINPYTKSASFDCSKYKLPSYLAQEKIYSYQLLKLAGTKGLMTITTQPQTFSQGPGHTCLYDTADSHGELNCYQGAPPSIRSWDPVGFQTPGSGLVGEDPVKGPVMIYRSYLGGNFDTPDAGVTLLYPMYPDKRGSHITIKPDYKKLQNWGVNIRITPDGSKLAYVLERSHGGENDPETNPYIFCMAPVSQIQNGTDVGVACLTLPELVETYQYGAFDQFPPLINMFQSYAIVSHLGAMCTVDITGDVPKVKKCISISEGSGTLVVDKEKEEWATTFGGGGQFGTQQVCSGKVPM